jgi:hypothetical protein
MKNYLADGSMIGWVRGCKNCSMDCLQQSQIGFGKCERKNENQFEIHN